MRRLSRSLFASLLLCLSACVEPLPCKAPPPVEPDLRTPDLRPVPQGCQCFQTGRWFLDNPILCLTVEGQIGSEVTRQIYTSQKPAMASLCSDTQALDSKVWSKDTLTADCAGTFRLCYTVKIGERDTPKDTDPVLGVACVDNVRYAVAGMTATLEPLKGWLATAMTNNIGAAALQSYFESGGYGEMSVVFVTDVQGCMQDESKVFNRVRYCPGKCGLDTYKQQDYCRNCTMDGIGGMF